MSKQSQNTNLHSAKTGKKDEFYTQLSDIEKELKHSRRVGFVLPHDITIRIFNP